MAGDNFDKTALTFGSTPVGPLLDLQHEDPDNEVAVGGSTSSEEVYEAGMSDNKVTAEIGGNTTAIVKGSTGDLGIVWNDGNSTIGIISGAVCVGKSGGGAKGGAITTRLSFRKKG